MKLLLDTHVVLWWLDDPLLLSLTAREAIADPVNDVLVSAAVCWEIAIKRGLGKLTAPADLRGALHSCDFRELHITSAHALATETLPMHHRDPFDRMLVAQAFMEGATLVSRDPMVATYRVSTITA
ncbi:MAG: type II toxin-antitoxin system VapC family toxin [Planctomycetota bacterium]